MNLTPVQLWLAISVVLFLLEVLVPLPTMLVAGAIGLSALFTGLVALVVPFVPVQIAIWLGFSALLIWFSRRFIPRDSVQLRDAEEGVTLTEVLPGQCGRVQYEGGSWQARCDDPKATLAPNQKVYVLRRQGTTLIVVPVHWLSDRD